MYVPHTGKRRRHIFLNKSLRKVFAIAALGLALVGCENSADVARKPEAISAAVQTSVEYCETGPVQSDYAGRLATVLADVRTADLDVLKANNITICMDQRLSAQDNGFFDGHMMGVFYKGSAPNGGGILSIWDNGHDPSFWKSDATDHGASLVSDFAAAVRDGKVKPADGHWYGYVGSYTTSCGKGCTSTHYYTEWTKNFDKDTLRKNPDIVQHAPVRHAPATPERPSW